MYIMYVRKSVGRCWPIEYHNLPCDTESENKAVTYLHTNAVIPNAPILNLTQLFHTVECNGSGVELRTLD